jgi:hypothetical protein
MGAREDRKGERWVMEGGEVAGAPHRGSVSGVASVAGPYR